MGLCGSSMTEAQKLEAKRNKAIANQLNDDESSDSQLIKLLLLGAGESGKSTIFKQMRILYGDGFDDMARRAMAPVIISNLLSGTAMILDNYKHQNINKTLEGEENIAAAELVQKTAQGDMGGNIIQEDVAAAIKTLWNDATFQEVHTQRNEFQLFSSYEDFAKACAKKYPDWGGQGWVPSVSDVTKARVRTSGIVEEAFLIDGAEFRMYDVGGQRNERKKWIHCFDSVTAVIFCGAISEYDQVLFEDRNQNRLIEAVDLFEEIANSKWFINTSIILFLNKKDLFIEKYLERKIPLNVTGLFPTAPMGAPNWDEAVAWLLDMFFSKSKNDKEIYHHITCATDQQNISTVFNACKDIILKKNLQNSGFLE